MKTMSLEEMRVEEKRLASRWVLVGTNEGTFSDYECHQAVGVGDPVFGNCRIYEQVGTGKIRYEGPSEDVAPGYLRRFSRELAQAQKELQAIRDRIKVLKSR